MAITLKPVNGVWYAWGKVKGVRVRKSTGFRVGTRKAEEQAQRAATEMEYRIRSENAGWEKPCLTVAEYWKKTYRPIYSAGKRAPQLDEQMMAHALPVIGDVRLDAVKKSDCVALLNRRRASYSRSAGQQQRRVAEGTVQRFRGFLQGFFQKAVDDEILDKNPWRTIERSTDKVRERLLTLEEQDALLPRLNLEYQRLVRFLLGTGVRIDECRGIDPATDIDWEARQITISDTVAVDGTLLFRSKGGKTRHVPIPLAIVDDLRAQIEECGRLWTQTDARIRAVLTKACTRRAAAPARMSRRGRLVPAIEARPAIDRIWPHALRHTFGWRFLKGGGEIYTLAQILGDTVAVTERHYAKLLAEDKRANVDRVDLGLGPRVKTGKVVAWPGQ